MLIGMVHALPLPGSPRAQDSVERLVEQAVLEARILAEAGFGGLILENMHDAPYVHGQHPPETVAVMTRIGVAVRQAVPGLRMGVQILSGGAREAVAVALAIGAEFVRVENFVFAHVADEGLLERAEAGPLLRYRRAIGAQSVQIYADIKKKHASHALTADLSLAEAARGAEFFGADGLIVTGTSTGQPTRPEDLAEVKAATGLPVLVGSGVTPDQLDSLRAADALIVGSWIKKGGHWSGPLDPERCQKLAQAYSAGKP